MNPKRVGVLKVYYPERGFGFIHCVESGVLNKFFIHISDVIEGEPVVGAEVHFNVNYAQARAGKPIPAADAEIKGVR